MAPKIATCCYCGTRAALKLCGTVQHELACASCGAPLHELKQMPMQSDKREKKQHYETPRYAKKVEKSAKKQKKKKSKSWGKKLFDGFDDVGDLFEDVLDIFD